MEALAKHLDALESDVGELERALDAGELPVAGSLAEEVNARIVRVRDALWSLRHDRFQGAFAARDLAGREASPAAIEIFAQIQTALAALDRLEVRGRDSAGVHVLVRDHALDIEDPEIGKAFAERSDDPLFGSMAVRNPDGCVSFVYKAAAEVGELGDNTSALRAAITADPLLHRAVEGAGARATVLAHTRWASVGLISEANAHPLTGEEVDRDGPFITAALNGDIDNYLELASAEGLRVHEEVTTDAKVLPVLVSRRRAEGYSLPAAFQQTVASLEGSVAVTANAAEAPGQLMCALRGSGQALYVGFAEDAFVVASEPYGIVGECRSYLRMDGETPADPADPARTRGQIVVLDDAAAGTLAGLQRLDYTGAPLPVREHELIPTEITTRDVDRGSFPHYLLKEISESPRSFRKTLRGKILEGDDRTTVALDADTIPEGLRERLRAGTVGRIFVIGSGTAAVAGRSLGVALSELLSPHGVSVEALAATELSGFKLTPDMSDALVVAISQSGTTTDTNRTVDLARSRGATVISIVNRRQSDLTDRSDGVLYTSDGRDIEMAVPSTKAFYAQVAAGFLLAAALAEAAGVAGGGQEELLEGLRSMPEAMERVLAQRETIGGLARKHAPSRRYWAVVGSGPNRIAADEVRIKLSELCYKSIPCDVTEDLKHLYLSAEPLVVVCAAGLGGSNIEDVAKETSIYRAHNAAPVVVASEGDRDFPSGVDVIRVPAVHPDLGFILSAMAGHLFAYEAALAIDAQAKLLREGRASVEAVTSAEPDPQALLERLATAIMPTAHRFFDALRRDALNGHLEASTAVRVASLLRYATGAMPLESYETEHGEVGTPGVLARDLVDALSAGIDELTRPVDAIKHQAKTVTVGISRADESLLDAALVQATLATGVPRDRLSYRTLRALAALDPTVKEVLGFTRYRVVGDAASEDAEGHVAAKGGIARDIPSRSERDPRLRGTKHRVAVEREVLVATGRADGRTVIIVPEVHGTQTIGITLLHARFHEYLPADVMRRVLRGYRDRYAALWDLVTETEPVFAEHILAEIPVTELLVSSIQVLADRWRSS